MKTGPRFGGVRGPHSVERRTRLTRDQLTEAAVFGRWLGLSLPQIGRRLGCHHTTVLHYLRRASTEGSA